MFNWKKELQNALDEMHYLEYHEYMDSIGEVEFEEQSTEEQLYNVYTLPSLLSSEQRNNNKHVFLHDGEQIIVEGDQDIIDIFNKYNTEITLQGDSAYDDNFELLDVECKAFKLLSNHNYQYDQVFTYEEEIQLIKQYTTVYTQELVTTTDADGDTVTRENVDCVCDMYRIEVNVDGTWIGGYMAQNYCTINDLFKATLARELIVATWDDCDVAARGGTYSYMTATNYYVNLNAVNLWRLFFEVEGYETRVVVLKDYRSNSVSAGSITSVAIPQYLHTNYPK